MRILWKSFPVNSEIEYTIIMSEKFPPSFIPENTPSELELAGMWTDNPQLKLRLAQTKSYLRKLAAIGNQHSHSPFSIEGSKILEEKFSGQRNTLDVSKGEWDENGGDYSEFEHYTDRMHNIQRGFHGPNLGTALELLFTDLNYLLFGNLLDCEVSSNFDDLARQVDTICFEKPFSKTKFLFGLDFTISKGDLYSTSKIGSKIDRLIGFIKNNNSFSVRYAEHKGNDIKFTAFNVPKLICYLDPGVLEKLAEHYYKMEHEKVLELISQIQEDIWISLYLEAHLLESYAKANLNYPMYTSYKRLKLFFRDRIPEDKRKYIIDSPYVGDMVAEIYKRRLKKD